jgi:anaerobic ribonucleoside-triphosphate reductase activating protein
MYVARILYPVEVLGYGKRIGIWFAGCPHGCESCSNPELWAQQPKQFISLENLLRLINEVCSGNTVDGFTITGGEPFYQSDDLEQLISALCLISDDILVYSGYTMGELRDMKNESVNRILDSIAVLIDGRYVEERNTGVVLRGSDNQQIHILDEKHKLRYNEYLKTVRNRIQNFNTSDGVVSVGIHKPGFKAAFESAAIKKGLVDANDQPHT